MRIKSSLEVGYLARQLNFNDIVHYKLINIDLPRLHRLL
jgi:hypothetical protein